MGWVGVGGTFLVYRHKRMHNKCFYIHYYHSIIPLIMLIVTSVCHLAMGRLIWFGVNIGYRLFSPCDKCKLFTGVGVKI